MELASIRTLLDGYYYSDGLKRWRWGVETSLSW